MSQAYNASACISFWAKGNANLRVEFGMKGSRKAQGMVPMSDWKQFTILFGELERENDPKTSPAFDPSQLIGIAFKHEGASFDFWLDEIQFVK